MAMPRSIEGYAYTDSFDCISRSPAFKLNEYIYVNTFTEKGVPICFRYHEDTGKDFIAFHASKFYTVRF